MPPSQTQTTEGIVFDGAVSAASVAVLAVLLVCATAWLLWRERHALGMGWALGFFVLRLGALGLALWMLAGPMHETIHRSTTSQSIAILADASASMATIDPNEPADARRWALALDPEAEETALTHGDRANVAIGVAAVATERAQQLLAGHRALADIKAAVNEARVALERTVWHCRQMSAQLSRRGDLVERIGRVESLLDGPIADSLSSLSKELEQQDAETVGQLTVALDDLQENIRGAARRLTSLSGDLAGTMADDGPSEMDSLTRREKTARGLDMLEAGVLGKLGKEVRVRRFRFDATLQPVAAEQSWSKVESLDGSRVGSNDHAERAAVQLPLTDLAAVLKQLSIDRATESTRLAVIYTDGHHNVVEGAAPQEVATQLMGLPVYFVPTGSALAVRDVKLHRVEAPSTVVLNDSALIEAIVTGFDYQGGVAEVVLRHDGKEIDRQVVDFPSARIDRRVQFRLSADELGVQDYELTVEPLEGEATVANNVVPVSWEVTRDKFRVLLCDSLSRWEFRYLQQLFRRDSHVECDELLFYPNLRGTGDLAARPRLPQQVDDWAVYDVVILGDIGPRQMSRASQQSLVDYVREQNGKLILIAGRDHMPHDFSGQPLLDLLPVENAPERVRAEAYSLLLTDEGRLNSALAIENSLRASEATWFDLFRRKPIHGLSTYCKPKPTARTLISAIPTVEAITLDVQSSQEDLPAFLCWQQVGAGRVAYLASPQTWLLRFRRGDRLHHRFWGQLIRWITAADLGSGSELVRLSTDKTRYNRGEAVEATVWLKDQTGRPLPGQTMDIQARTLDDVAATAPLAGDAEVPGRYFAKLDGLPAGAFELVVSGDIVRELLASADQQSEVRVMITIESGESLELLDTTCNRALLEQVAEITGGQVVPPTAVAEVLELASLSPEISETVERAPLWNRWSNLWIVLGCLFVEWIVRKHKGLV